jgi:hypothetical protein
MKRKAISKRLHSSARQKKQPRYTEQQIAALQKRALKLWRADTAALKQSDDTAAQLGRVLIEVRDALRWTHGSFKQWWQKNEFTQARVSYCMRLAQGKVATAKFRLARSPQRVAVTNVKKEVAEFLKYCANQNAMQTVEQLHVQLSNVVLHLVDGVSRMREWKLVSSTDSNALAAKKNLHKALWEFLDAAFIPVNLNDLDQITNGVAAGAGFGD